MGINKDELLDFIQNPTKHRKNKNLTAKLSRGQRKRLEKKEKFSRRKVLEEKIALSKSMINNTNANKTLNLTLNPNKNKKDDFNLLDINNTLMNSCSSVIYDSFRNA